METTISGLASEGSVPTIRSGFTPMNMSGLFGGVFDALSSYTCESVREFGLFTPPAIPRESGLKRSYYSLYYESYCPHYDY